MGMEIPKTKGSGTTACSLQFPHDQVGGSEKVVVGSAHHVLMDEEANTRQKLKARRKTCLNMQTMISCVLAERRDRVRLNLSGYPPTALTKRKKVSSMMVQG